MIYKTKEIMLKDGRKAFLRAPAVSDCAELVEYMKKSAAETDFLTRYPDEITQTEEDEREFIMSVLSSGRKLMIVCTVDNEIAGNCQIVIGGHEKNKHRATVMIALLRKFWGRGIGSAMLEELETEARKHSVTQLELSYMDGNERALALYRKMGFCTVSRLPRAYKFRDGSYHDEICMIKTLD